MAQHSMEREAEAFRRLHPDLLATAKAQRWEPAEAIRKMAEWQQGHFDNTVFHAFVKTIGIYPSGTLVKLKSTRLAVVTEQSGSNLRTPIVKVFFSTKANAPIQPDIIDLSQSTDSILNAEDPQKWGFDIKKLTGI